jgi:hypothetical protein
VNGAIVGFGILAAYFGVMAVVVFVRSLRKPPRAKDLDEDFFLGSDSDR